jgi:hypothetical protein
MALGTFSSNKQDRRFLALSIVIDTRTHHLVTMMDHTVGSQSNENLVNCYSGTSTPVKVVFCLPFSLMAMKVSYGVVDYSDSRTPSNSRDMPDTQTMTNTWCVI